MRKLIVSEFVTLDGVMEDTGGGEKSRHGAWSFKYGSDDMYEFKFDELRAVDAHLLGRVTYQGFAAAWPNMKDGGDFADRMNNLPHYVVSTTLKEATWNNSRIIRDKVAEEVTRLKQQPGLGILVAGSAQLVETLRQHDLVDEYRLLVHPVVLGSGKRIFKDGTEKRSARKMLDSKPFNRGVL